LNGGPGNPVKIQAIQYHHGSLKLGLFPEVLQALVQLGRAERVMQVGMNEPQRFDMLLDSRDIPEMFGAQNIFRNSPYQILILSGVSSMQT